MNGINNKAILVMVALLAVLLVLEPTSDLVVTIVSLPFQVIKMVLGFVFSIINWGMLVMVAIGFTVAFIAKTRSVDWLQVKSFFNKEEV